MATQNVDDGQEIPESPPPIWPSTRVGAAQVVPLKTIAFPVPSTATQKDADEQETACSPANSESMDTAAPQPVPS